MEKYLIIIRKVAWLICLCTFVLSCDQISKPPAKPKVVRKKIIAQKDKPATTRKVKKAEPARVKPAARQPQKPEAPQPRPPGKAPQKPKVQSPMRIAKKNEPSAKPAIAPKSDISTPQQPTKAQPQPPQPDEKTLKADTKAAAEAFTTEPQKPTADVQLAGTRAPLYNPRGKVDPFEPLFKQTTVVAKKPKQERKKRVPRTPLERIDLSQLKLVAIVRAKSGNRAMVEESSGKGYIISKGTYIGTNAGKVTQIQGQKVIVSEEVEDVMGNVSIRKTELKLPKPPGEL